MTIAPSYNDNIEELDPAVAIQELVQETAGWFNSHDVRVFADSCRVVFGTVEVIISLMHPQEASQHMQEDSIVCLVWPTTAPVDAVAARVFSEDLQLAIAFADIMEQRLGV